MLKLDIFSLQYYHLAFLARLLFSLNCLSPFRDLLEVSRYSDRDFFFFDDGVGAGASFPVAQNNSEFVRLSLVKSGFLVNREKSLWGPTRRFSWIGYVIDTHSGIISASDSRMEKCSADLNEVCATLDMSSSVHVKTLVSLVGQIISFGSSFGNITRIMSRYLHHAINSRSSWRAHVFLTSEARRELLFWRDNLRDINGVLFWPSPSFPSKIVFSDASATGCAAFIQGSTEIFHRNWSSIESQKSSI